MNSPLHFNPGKLFGLGAIQTGIKAIKNRKEYGGGLKGIVKAGVADVTGEHEDNKLDSINEKLDTLVSAMDEQPQDVNQDPSLAPPAPFAPATPLNFKEFMTSTTQDPATNGTGSANPVFGDVRPMSVADPNINTKGSLFNKQQNF
tara:strand:+ start:1002 stop:1439 length:438 start_codon:yes stop_codon:yes gene_type:complete